MVARARFVHDPVARLQHPAVVLDGLSVEYQEFLATGVHVRDRGGAGGRISRLTVVKMRRPVRDSLILEYPCPSACSTASLTYDQAYSARSM